MSLASMGRIERIRFLLADLATRGVVTSWTISKPDRKRVWCLDVPGHPIAGRHVHMDTKEVESFVAGAYAVISTEDHSGTDGG